MKRIYIIQTGDCYSAVSAGDPTMPSEPIPLPYTLRADIRDIIASLQAKNPGHQIINRIGR